MIYLDYSATTPVDKKVLECFDEGALHHFGNPNSSHRLGEEAKNMIDAASASILSLFQAPDREIIYTGGASEANNLAIKGIASKKGRLGKHLITTAFEHPSVTACFGYLQNQGFEVDFAPTDAFGCVDLEAFRKLLRPDTILVSVAAVNSEIGMVQPIEEIGRILKDFPFATFHSDMTQAIGKIPVSIQNVDLVTFAAHKFYGLKGIGGLIHKKNVLLDPQIHGGKSTTSFRSGTPALPLIVSTALALELAFGRLDAQYRYVFGLGVYLRERLSPFSNIVFNSHSACIPHIVNLSVLTRDAQTLQKKLDAQGICVSTQTACHAGGSRSEAVHRLTGDERRAKSSIRVSLSHLTTMEEIDALVAALGNEASQ